MTILGDLDINAPNPTSNRTTTTTTTTTTPRKSIVFDDSDEDNDGYSSASTDESDEDYDTAMGRNKSNIGKRKVRYSIEGSPTASSSNNTAKVDAMRVSSVHNHNSHNNNNNNNNNSNNNKAKNTPNPKPRKRRRSSARFLRLSGRFDTTAPEFDDENNEERQKQLGEMYRKAIQLNAQNKINAENSWGINLIENIDKFLGDDEDGVDGIGGEGTGSSHSRQMGSNDVRNNDSDGNELALKEKRVNFTKASCTLDASVKIYSYRVDDVHLTSYKVLANLNRNDDRKEDHTTKNLVPDANDSDSGYDEGAPKSTRKKKSIKRVTVETLDVNKTTINVSKMDSKYVIDPIFAKLSKKQFDEGGVKGLLLVNLNVANDGCRIVLDSTEKSSKKPSSSTEEEEDYYNDDDEEESSYQRLENEARKGDEEEGDEKDGNRDVSTPIDISCLTDKLQELLSNNPIETIPFVPQLTELRRSYEELQDEGFVAGGNPSKSMLYANDADDEKAAEEEIHREALERTQTSIGLNLSSFPNDTSSSIRSSTASASHRMSSFGQVGEVEPVFDTVDFGGSHDDGFDDDDHHESSFNEFPDPSSQSAPNLSVTFGPDKTIMTQDQDEAPSPDKVFDATFLSQFMPGDEVIETEKEKINNEALESFLSGNQWAGSSQWNDKSRTWRKSMKNPNDIASGIESKKGGKKSKSKSKPKSKNPPPEPAFIDLHATSHECLDSLLKKLKIDRKTKAPQDKMQLTDTMKRKYMKENNLLPFDAKVSINDLTSLFARPMNKSMPYYSNDTESKGNSIGFLGDDNFASNDFDDGDDNSYGGDCMNDNDMMGDDQNFVGTDDYQVFELEGVRKVDKIQISHARVSKKVDVKKLKNDLWIKVEDQCGECPGNVSSSRENDEEENESMTTEHNPNNDEAVTIADHNPNEKGTASFQETVQSMESSQTQENISCAYYFICMLHLANEKGLKLENAEYGLTDFIISHDADNNNSI